MQRAARLPGGVSDKFLGNIHHSVIIGVCLIQLNTCEFGIVPYVHTLVSEVSADLVNAFHTAHDKPFKIKLRGYAQIHIQIERVVMRYERSCRRSTGNGVEHRRFNFDKSVAVKIISD